ncbi:MAG: UDP-N-acetylmuramate--L-alanine ligase [Bacteroidales bacterium]|nr:UDP-N-acetylmuramate--L-alanine ligase [Bacteroidales bacterium]MDD4576151.1 UDP-N-acetylmuramate--L-alanine ligase [Bacteroidales bacterium]
MKNIRHKTVYFLGIGGIGMSALAKFYVEHEANVYGYDLTPSHITDELTKQGVKIHFEDNPSLLPPKIDLAIYTPAIPKNHKEYNFLKKQNVKLLKRAQILGEISEEFNTIAIAGTHGKTTTTAICAQIFKAAGHKINAFIGGIANNFKSNCFFENKAQFLIVEADEFDRSFLTLSPNTAIITSMDADHLDIYNNTENLISSFYDFIEKIKPGGTLIYHVSLKVPETHRINTLSYSVNNSEADIYASNISYRQASYTFDLHFKDKIFKNLKFNFSGHHNLENAIAACGALLLQNRISEIELSNALSSFQGVHRRFEIVFDSEKTTLIDDYAHHPTEIRNCLSSIKAKYPDKKITVVFQPHLFSRTQNFADDFAKALSAADRIILLNIYPAREEPIKGIDSQFLLDKIQSSDKKLVNDAQLADQFKDNSHQVIVMMGAGNIDRLVPLVKKQLETNSTL